MQLSQEQKERVKAHFNKKLRKEDNCSACGKNEWFINDGIYGLWEFGVAESEGSADVGVTPIIILTCENCGYLRFFHAVATGLEITEVEIGQHDEANIRRSISR